MVVKFANFEGQIYYHSSVLLFNNHLPNRFGAALAYYASSALNDLHG